MKFKQVTEAVRERDASLLLDLHEVPHGQLLCVVGLGGVARRRPDA